MIRKERTAKEGPKMTKNNSKTLKKQRLESNKRLHFLYFLRAFYCLFFVFFTNSCFLNSYKNFLF